MTQKQIDQYELAYDNNYYLCQCGKKATHMAHRISNTKKNRKKYGKKIIDDYRNLVPVCSLKCNDSFNIGNKPLICEKLVFLITNDGQLSTQNITKYLGE